MTHKNTPDKSRPDKSRPDKSTIDKQPSVPTVESADAPADPGRRRLLGGMALAGAALATTGCQPQSSTKPAAGKPATAAGSGPRDATALDAALREHIRHVVVIYAENRAFNNLFADFPGLQNPLAALKPEQYRQRDRDGSELTTLPPIWHGLVKHEQVVNHRTWKIDEDAITGLPNAPFALAAPDGTPLPHGVVTRDLIHAFYQNQQQINGGKNDGFVAWGDSGALVMGHYADSASNLRLWRLAEQYTLCDNFFMGAFGGSFLNHQYLVAAQPPYYPHADTSPAKLQIARIEGDDPTGLVLKLTPDSPASAMQGRAKPLGPNALTPDFWAVNTMGPPYQPAWTKDPAHPLLADPNDYGTLPPQVHANIGDRLSAGGVDWAWYAGAWQMALDGNGDHGIRASFPESPNFQNHHQPLNYFKNLAPGTAARGEHLRDGGTGETPKTNRLLAAIEAGELPTVTFYKPQGNLNMHAGYSDVEAGDRHITQVVAALQKSPLWQHAMVIITVDENGGWWDHVAPPKGDRWGPGTRIPALVVSPHAKKGHVEHTIYDTGSIQRFLNRRFNLEPLPGIVMRDKAMIAAGGKAPGDLTETLQFG
ncbi:acid phosphatase [Rhodanobacter sp. 115]|uniref:acid phosphatase n=2 Tax=Rhodanobacter sp. FW021-MT20 TaxID=1162282 RepID=UPI0034E452F8